MTFFVVFDVSEFRLTHLSHVYTFSALKRRHASRFEVND